MTLERVLLQTIKFDLQVDHPYSSILKYAKCLKGDKPKLQKMVQMSWTFVNDSLCTTLCLQWEPEVIAIALMYLASKLSKFEVRDWKNRTPEHKYWWDQHVRDLETDVLEDICHQVLDLYSQPTTETKLAPQSPPPSLGARPKPPPTPAASVAPTPPPPQPQPPSKPPLPPSKPAPPPSQPPPPTLLSYPPGYPPSYVVPAPANGPGAMLYPSQPPGGQPAAPPAQTYASVAAIPPTGGQTFTPPPGHPPPSLHNPPPRSHPPPPSDYRGGHPPLEHHSRSHPPSSNHRSHPPRGPPNDGYRGRSGHGPPSGPPPHRPRGPPNDGYRGPPPPHRNSPYSRPPRSRGGYGRY